ncbi:MAG TPA: DUF4032 domain-containing protein [Acidimicrobiales bacterium]|nr:DUF4032 domain-containing protein [Acidimicrobiales bacterium]
MGRESYTTQVVGLVIEACGDRPASVRYLLRPPADVTSGLLTLPWHLPLDDWRDDRLVEIRHRGTSRHVVRFVSDMGNVYALKEMNEPLVRREYRLLKELNGLGVPSVEPVGIVYDRGSHEGTPLDAILCTAFLEYSMTYRALYSDPHRPRPTDRLLDSLVELLVRLHLAGFFWGDCSLSNTLFRLDAGAFQAIFVDAETSELHATLTRGQRNYDVDLAYDRVGGELMDLAAAGLLPADAQPEELAEQIPLRYQRLWDALTEDVVIQPAEQRMRIAERLRRLNELGFDADEVELVSADQGYRLRIRTRVAEAGHHRHSLRVLTGLDVQENQARRILNDIASYRGHLEKREGRRYPVTVAASRWLVDVYDKVMALMPAELLTRLAPAEVIHEVLEHRWFLSEKAGRDIGTTAAAKDYFEKVLPFAPEGLVAATGDPAMGRFGEDTGSWFIDPPLRQVEPPPDATGASR